MAKLKKRPIAQAGVGIFFSNREAQEWRHPSTPACAQPARQIAAGMALAKPDLSGGDSGAG